MSDTAIQVDRVWKKFRRGESFDSLRELIPAMFRRLFKGAPDQAALKEREFWVLKDISFEVKKGQSLGIIGPNGAGKSTMFKLLSRIIKPTQGNYIVNGRLSALIEVGAGFHQDLTGRENIYLNGTILGMTKRQIKAKEDAIIDFSGVDKFIDTPVKRYSSGMLARLGFAVAANMEPEILLVDEVLSVGDARFRQKCVKHMRSLKDSNVTVLFVSHILDQVRTLCPNTLVLDRGEMVYHGATDGAIRKYLDILALADTTTSAHDEKPDAEVINIRFTDEQGNEVLEWPVRKTGFLECDLVLHKRVDVPAVLINFYTIGGMYLGTANTLYDGCRIPESPGTYHLRFAMDPMPLGDGDFTVEFKVHAGEDQMDCLWTQQQQRTLSVRGGKAVGTPILCEGVWQVTRQVDSRERMSGQSGEAMSGLPRTTAEVTHPV